MAFSPPFCPGRGCPSHAPGAAFRYQKRGSYRRKCDGARVRRFSCRACGRRFSRQTFRFNYRWWRPHVHHELFRLFTAKVTMRQAARMTGLSRDTVARRMREMGRQCRGVQDALLCASPRLAGTFLLDELETFETDRRLRPVTVPVLIQGRSLLVVHATTAPLPPRGRLDAWRTLRLLRERDRHGRRRCGSRAAVRRSLDYLASALAPTSSLDITTDRKRSYPPLVHEVFSRRFGSHARIASTRRRDRGNPLFPVNHTLAMMRDGVSRLVRRSWAASKLRARLEEHLWIWIAYRNYVRGLTVELPRLTPAMAAGITVRPWTSADVFRWKWPGRMP